MSNSFNFVGTIGRDAEVKHLSSGSAVLTVTVANNVGYGEKQKTNWVRVTLFGKRAEGNLSGLLIKGQQVFVSGELILNEYQTKDGSTKSNLEVNANIIDLVGGKREQAATAKPKPVSASDDFDDTIPF